MKSNSTEVKAVAEKLEVKLSRYFGCTPKDASAEQMYKATAMTIKDILTEKRKTFKDKVNNAQGKRVYYMCMEFLLGRSLKTNLCNLGLVDAYQGALKKFGFDIEELYELEPDAGLGNGGLG
ncbi:MAG: glycogen/starch/alpha-glucan phosphorylase, partial [Clostridia bacterium]|nr:glycogen/starch/alpha-glucan phosphorylase [Clostridia bacterium]